MGDWGISCKLALTCMSLYLTDDKSKLVQIMAWCCQATSHYLSQCWPRSLSPYGVTRPQWVKKMLSCLLRCVWSYQWHHDMCMYTLFFHSIDLHIAFNDKNWVIFSASDGMKWSTTGSGGSALGDTLFDIVERNWSQHMLKQKEWHYLLLFFLYKINYVSTNNPK